MGMAAIPFAVDIDKVKSVFGSKDKTLLEKVKTTEMYDNYVSQSEDHSDPKWNYNFDEVLEDIIFKYIKPEERKSSSSLFGLKKEKQNSGLKEDLGYGYGYALIAICDCLGEHLFPFCDGIYYGREFEDVYKTLREHGLQIDMSMMFEPHNVFDIPRIQDFPAIYCYSKQDIHHISAVLERIAFDESKTDFENEDFDEVQELLKNLRDAFNRCRELDVEMVTFTH